MKGFSLLFYLITNLRTQLKKHRLQPDKLCWRIIAQGTPVPDQTYDLAVAYLEGGSTYFVADAVHAKKKAAFVHIDYADAGYHKGLDLDSYSRIDRIFSVSKEACESFCRIYPEYQDKCFLFRNILDTKQIRSRRIKNLAPNDPFIKSRARYKLLTVGRLNYQKAYDIAIPALRILRDRGYDVDWFVLGEGSLKKELCRQIDRENLTGHFVLLGSKENPYPYSRLADLYVHATRFEGKSIAVQEAKILGCPILVSDCNGNREQVKDGVDGSVCALTPESVSTKIEELLENEMFNNKLAMESLTLLKGDFKGLDKTKKTLIVSNNCSFDLSTSSTNTLGSFCKDYFAEKGYMVDTFDINKVNQNVISELNTLVKKYDAIVLAFSNVQTKNETQIINLVNTITKNNKEFIVIGLDSPYDIMCYGNISIYINVYGYQKASCYAISRFLNGEFKACGKSPIKINY